MERRSAQRLCPLFGMIDGMISGCYYNGMGKINAKRDLNKLYILFYVDAINVTLTQQRKQSHSIYFN